MHFSDSTIQSSVLSERRELLRAGAVRRADHARASAYLLRQRTKKLKFGRIGCSRMLNAGTGYGCEDN
eukprot:3884148-Pleurochrysis_carterae.AAC.1